MRHRRILGQKIRFYRERAGFTQEKLAEKAGLSYKYLGEVERGLVNISLDSLVKLARALRIRVRSFVQNL